MQIITDEYGEMVGRFDVKKATRFDESRDWNGNNMISRATGSQWDHEVLYHTPNGRWVLNHWSGWQGSRESWTLVSEAEAHRWLIQNDEADAITDAQAEAVVPTL